MEFKGFSQNNQFKLLSSIGYKGPNDESEMSKFIESSPAAAAKMGKWARKASERFAKRGFAEGGLVTDQQALDEAQKNYGEDSSSKNQQALAQAQTAFALNQVLSPSEATQTAVDNPTSIVTPSNVEKVVETQGQIIDPSVGKDTTKEQATATTVQGTQVSEAPERTDANLVSPTVVTEDVKDELSNLEASTASPSEKATVRGQMQSLMEEFEGDETPPWASGAMRSAMALMQQRGLGASSMAGQAITQAAMESALAIAGQDAKTNAQFEMQNLSNEQQTSIFKTQQTITSMFTDQAVENTAKQINAASKNQVDQFYADLESTVSRFNADQINAILKFNAGEENAIEVLNENLQAQRDQFNATNDLVIAQANAQWRQMISTTNTAAQNTSNMQAAQTAQGLTSRALDHIWQKERDIMAYAFQSAENSFQRSHNLLMADKSVAAQRSASKKSALGFLAGKVLFG